MSEPLELAVLPPRELTDEEIVAQLAELDPSEFIEAEDDYQEQYYSADDARNMAERDLNFLAALAVPDMFKFAFAPIFVVLWNMLATAVKKIKSFDRFAIGLPRGHGKSTIIKLFVVFIILFTKRKFILVVAARDDLAVNIITDAMNMLSHPNIINLFGNWQDTAASKRGDLKNFHFRGRDVVLAGLGFNSSIRGLNLNNARPDFMIFDDAQTRECAMNPVLAEQFADRLYGTFLKLKSPAGCTYVYIGNMYKNMQYEKPGNPRKFWCCQLRQFKDDPNWTSFITGAILADGKALWPQLYSKEELIEELKVDSAAGQEDNWFAEVQNDPEAQTACQFDYARIKVFKRSELPQAEGAYLIIDPSLGNLTSDQQMVGHFEVLDGLQHCYGLFPVQTNPKILIETVLTYAMQHRIPAIFVESVAYQKTLVFWFNEFTTRLNIVGIRIYPLSPAGRKKNNRIMTMLRNFLPGNLPISEEAYPIALHQIEIFDPKTDKNLDDALDVLAYSEDVMLITDPEVNILRAFEIELLHPQEPVAEMSDNTFLGAWYG